MGTQQHLIDPTPLDNAEWLSDSPPEVNAGSPCCFATWRQPILVRTLETK
jgi:hypothetical protein